MREDGLGKTRVMMLVLLALFVADAWWFIEAFIKGLAALDVPRLLLGIALQALGVWALVAKMTNTAPGSRLPGLLVAGCLAMGAASA